MRKDISGAKKIALSGILLSLTTLVLFAAAILPTNKLSLYTLSSFFVAVIITELGIKAGWAFYVASGLLGFLALRGSIGGFIAYAAFFGLYGIIKYYTEKLPNRGIEYAAKIFYFNIALFLVISFARTLFFDPFALGVPPWVIIAAAQVLFLFYDYLFTLFVRYYNEKIRNKLKL